MCGVQWANWRVEFLLKKKKLRHIQFYQSSIIDVGRRKELVVGNENDFYVQQNDFYVHIPHIHSVLDDGHWWTQNSHEPCHVNWTTLQIHAEDKQKMTIIYFTQVI